MTHADTYKTIAAPSKGLYKDKGSKFISLAYPVNEEEQIKEILSDVKKEFYDARHHCYAWVLGADKGHYRQNDDGEPSGTAGKPIYGQILSDDLTNILIVVVRYFGETKLGVRGLINAYKGASRDALDNTKVITKTIRDHYQLTFEYLSMNEVMKVLKDYDLPQLEHDFDLSCKLTFSVRKKIKNAVIRDLEKIPGVAIRYLETK